MIPTKKTNSVRKLGATLPTLWCDACKPALPIILGGLAHLRICAPSQPKKGLFAALMHLHRDRNTNSPIPSLLAGKGPNCEGNLCLS